MTALPIHAPEMPGYMQPCNGCGYCCAAEVCEVGKALHGEEQSAPCPSMRFRAGRFWCDAVALADEISPEHGFFLRLKMGIGVGCDCDDEPSKELATS
jgi:hypothetical protein